MSTGDSVCQHRIDYYTFSTGNVVIMAKFAK